MRCLHHPLKSVVSQYFASWNRIDVWLRQLDRIHRVA